MDSALVAARERREAGLTPNREPWPTGNVSERLLESPGAREGRSAHEIADYDATAGATRRALRALSGKQPGDPVRAANAIIQAVESPAPPLHLLLGRDALQMARAKLEALRGDFDAWEKVTVGADFPTAPPAAVATPSSDLLSRSSTISKR